MVWNIPRTCCGVDFARLDLRIDPVVISRLRAAPINLGLAGMIMTRTHWIACLLLALVFGCERIEQQGEQVEGTGNGVSDSQEGTRKKNSILGKTTQDIGKFEPHAGHTVVDSKIRARTPGLAALESYGPLAQKAADLGVQQRIAHFHAIQGRYPTYEEFMSQIVKNRQAPLRLPVLPGKKRYYYDEANHSIVVVDAAATSSGRTAE